MARDKKKVVFMARGKKSLTTTALDNIFRRKKNYKYL
jgi:hypothetical protein